MTRRVVITGVGGINSLGNDIPTIWQNMLQGKNGIKKINTFPTDRFNCKIASTIENFVAEDFISKRDLKKMDRFIVYGLVAAEEAIRDSGWLPEKSAQKERTGVIVGSGIGGLQAIEQSSISLSSSEKNKLSPFFIPSCLINLLSGHIAMNHGYMGPNSAVSTACATGAHAIGDAARIIKYGDADVMVAGGAEAPITPVGLGGFDSLRALSTQFNDQPHEASRPWDQGHDGFVMGEGSGIVVLEEYEHAKQRGANIYAEVLGYGMSGDAHHITAPSGDGAKRAVKIALKDARIDAGEVNYVNAHGTSTPVGDQIELEVIQELFSDNKDFRMSSTKSAIGHLLGAAGSSEIIFTALAIRDSVAPPTLNLHNPLEIAKINLVPLHAQETRIKYAVSNSFGFGGTNASVVLGSVDI